MAWDFVKYPELPNSMMNIYYADSPHKQVIDDLWATCVKVTDGDTIRVEWNERDFDFPIRLIDIDAPELKAEGGKDSQSWLEQRILGEEIYIQINPERRVGKWGRILGRVLHGGLDVNDEAVMMGKATTFEERFEGQLPDLQKEFKKWR